MKETVLQFLKSIAVGILNEVRIWITAILGAAVITGIGLLIAWQTGTLEKFISAL